MTAASHEQLAAIVAGLGALPSQERTVAVNVALARARVQLERRAKRAAAQPPALLVQAATLPVALPAPAPTARQLFTEEEQAGIRRLYPTATWPELLLVATGRTRQQIMSWAIYHGLKRTKQARATAQSVATKGKPHRSPGERRKSAPTAHSGTVATPVLNARVAARTKKDGPSAIGRMLEQMRKLPGSHPRRLAYAEAARTGTGLDAYEAWKNWKPANAA